MEKISNFCIFCNSNVDYSDLINVSEDILLDFRKKFYEIFQIKIIAKFCKEKYTCGDCINKINNLYEFFMKIRSNVLNNFKAISIFENNKNEHETINENNEENIEKLTAINENLCLKIEILNTNSETENTIHGEVEALELHEETISDTKTPEQCHRVECNSNKSENSNDSTQNKSHTYNENDNEKNPDDIPKHLLIRASKKISDATILSFMDLKCEMCEKTETFCSFKEMQVHYETQHKTRGFLRCCGKKIFRKDRVIDHITLHINPDAYKCPKCGQRSKSKVLLRIHMKQHLPVEDRPFKCKKCNRRFVLRSQLSNHQATHLSAEEKKYICDECGKAFALKFVLLKHKTTHTLEKQYFCEVCAKAFTSKGNLTSHVRTHVTKPQPRVQCKECGQWYKNLQTLRSHIHRHRDTQEHTCKICSKKCSSKSSLLQHVRYVHDKTSNFECNICHKQFRRKPELTEHIARHTGEVLYQCKFCPKTFFSSSNYFAHRKTKHPKEYATLTQQTQT